MTLETYRACIDACHACAAACDYCSAACLAEDNPKALARCIGLDTDCATVCSLAAAFMARGSPRTKLLCSVCAEVCDQCAEECERHGIDHCRQCAAACRRCAQECRRVVG